MGSAPASDRAVYLPRRPVRGRGQAPGRRALRGRQDHLRRHAVGDPAAAHRGDDDAGRRAHSTTSPGCPDKTTTTVAMDFGRLTLSDSLVLYLFGAPGQQRFAQLWQDMTRGALGALVLADTRRLEHSFDVMGAAGGVRPAVRGRRQPLRRRARRSPRRTCARHSTCCPRPRSSPATPATAQSSTEALIALVQYLHDPQPTQESLTDDHPVHRPPELPRPAARLPAHAGPAPAVRPGVRRRSRPPSTRGCASTARSPRSSSPPGWTPPWSPATTPRSRCCAATDAFSKDPRRWKALAEGVVPADSPVVPMMAYRPNACAADGDEHRRLRGAIDDSLARIDPNALRGYVERSADTLIDRFGARGTADLLGDYAKQLPLLVLIHGSSAARPSIGDRLLAGMPRHLRRHRRRRRPPTPLDRGRRRTGRASSASEPGRRHVTWLMEHEAHADRRGAGPPARPADRRRHRAAAEPHRQRAAPAAVRRPVRRRPRRRQPAGRRRARRGAVDRPAAWPTTRMHYPFHDVEIDGVRLPAGPPVVISFAAANTDPALAADQRGRQPRPPGVERRPARLPGAARGAA